MRKRFPWFVFLVCTIGFVLGLSHLFQLRFDAGDIYPEYSSLRADPLGTMALCESLERMPGISVRRDFSAENQLPHGKSTAYLHLGARTRDWHSLDEEVIKEIEGFVTSGGRLAISFFPETTKPFQFFPDDNEAPAVTPEESNLPPREAPKRAKKKSKRSEREAARLRRLTSLKERWGIDFAYPRLAPGTTTSYEPASVELEASLPLPESLNWHSATVFTNLPSSWDIIYSRGTNPVVIQRKFGAGSIVLATDSYFLSNEALRKERHADLLAWWIGPAKHVIFDEAHFGIVETQGVAALIRKYRLHGLAVGLVLLAGLFIWKNSSSFVPPFQSAQPQDYVKGKEGAAGLVNLLRRNIPERELLNVCFAEWKKSYPPAVKLAPARQAQAEAVLEEESLRPERQRTPVARYQEIVRLLKRI